MPAGRPSEFTMELADYICSEIAGGTNLKRLCDRKDMPARITVYRWLRQNPEFDNNYVKAIKNRADYRYDTIDDVVDEMRTGKIDPQVARIQIDTIKWQTGKEKPKTYGDTVRHTGDEEQPIVVKDITEYDKGLLERFLKLKEKKKDV